MQMASSCWFADAILVTVGLLILVRLGVHLPVPGIDRVSLCPKRPKIAPFNWLSGLVLRRRAAVSFGDFRAGDFALH